MGDILEKESNENSKIFIDGSGFNGVDSSYCIYFKNFKKTKILEENHSGLFMEALALLDCLKECEDDSIIYSDCQILVGYINYNWISHLKEINYMVSEIKKLIKDKKCKLIWIPREKNKAGIYLQNRLFKIYQYKNEWRTKVKRKRW